MAGIDWSHFKLESKVNKPIVMQSKRIHLTTTSATATIEAVTRIPHIVKLALCQQHKMSASFAMRTAGLSTRQKETWSNPDVAPDFWKQGYKTLSNTKQRSPMNGTNKQSMWYNKVQLLHSPTVPVSVAEGISALQIHTNLKVMMARFLKNSRNSSLGMTLWLLY